MSHGEKIPDLVKDPEVRLFCTEKNNIQEEKKKNLEENVSEQKCYPPTGRG